MSIPAHSFGSALHRNCRINRFTVGDQIFELPDRYIFERDLGKGAYGFVCACKVPHPPSAKKKSERKEKFSEWPPLCAASGVGDVCVFFVVVLVLFVFCCCTRLHRYTRFTHAEVMRVQRVLVYLYMLKGEYWYS